MAMAMQGHVGWGGAGRGEARGKRGAQVEGTNGAPMIGLFCAVDTREMHVLIFKNSDSESENPWHVHVRSVA